MKLTKALLYGISALIVVTCISFIVPEPSEFPGNSSEAITAVNLSESGQQLLLRTLQHDYEFALPANRLNDVFNSPPPGQTSYLSGRQPGAFIDTVIITPQGNASTTLTVRIGGYDSRLSETKSVLSSRERAFLQTLGLTPSNGNVCCDIDPALYMAWEGNLTGHQYPAGSRPALVGTNLGDLSVSDIEIVMDDPAALERHHTINMVLKPLVKVKRGLMLIVYVAFMLVTGNIPAFRG